MRRSRLYRWLRRATRTARTLPRPRPPRGLRGLLRALVLLGGLAALPAPVVHAAGPWRGQVVDAATGAPVPDVVVLLVWERRPEGHLPIRLGPEGFDSAAEAVTDAAGRFEIAARPLDELTPSLLFHPLVGPALYLMRLGYGGWRFEPDRDDLTAPAGARIALRPLRTRAERVQYLDARWPDGVPQDLRRAWTHVVSPEVPGDLPVGRAPRFEAAFTAARAAVALPPLGLGRAPRPRDVPVPDVVLGVQPWPPSGHRVGPPAWDTPRTPPPGPMGLAADATGRVYVLEPARHRLRVFTRHGAPLATWGGEGEGPGQFRHPLGVATAPDGSVVVADTGNQRVQRFDPSGAVTAVWGRPGLDAGAFRLPAAIAVGPDGDVYVGDSLLGRVQRFRPDGRFVQAWAVGGVGSTAAGALDALAVDAQGAVYVLENTGHASRIHRVEADPAAGRATWQGYRPVPRLGGGGRAMLVGLAAAPDGHLFALDRDGHRLLRLGPAGQVEEIWGQAGGGPGELWQPQALAVDPAGTVYVSDWGNTRIQTYTPDGALRRAWGGFAEEDAALAALRLRGASAVATDAEGVVYVADTEHHQVVVYGPDLTRRATWGRQGTAPGQFERPRAVAVGRDGTVYVGDTGHHRIQAFAPDGRLRRVWAVPPADLAAPIHTVGVTDDGEVLVAARHGIARFTATGERRGAWTARGASDTLGPAAVDREGRVYSLTGPGAPLAVRVHDREGRRLATWGPRGIRPGEISASSAITVGLDGRVYVADRVSPLPRLQVFDADGTFRWQWSRADGLPPDIHWLEAVAVGPRGQVTLLAGGAPGPQGLVPSILLDAE